VESAGIPDLGLDDGRAVTSSDVAVRGGTEAASINVRMDVGPLIEPHVLSDLSEVATDFQTASHRLEVRIDKFTNHDLLQRVCIWFVFVNNPGSKRTSASLPV